MKRWIALLLGALLLVSAATAAVAAPLHIGGGPALCSAPLHIGGGPIAE